MDITVTLKDGRVLRKHIEHAVGSLARPMSDADLDQKCRGQCKGILSAARASDLGAMCWNVGKVKRVAEIARASVPGVKPKRKSSKK